MGLLYNEDTAVKKPLRYTSINSSLTNLTQSGEVVSPDYSSQETSVAENYQVVSSSQTFAGIGAGVTQTLNLNLPQNILLLEFGYIANSTAGIDQIKLLWNTQDLVDGLTATSTYLKAVTPLDETNAFEENTVTISARNTGGVGNLTIGVRIKFIYL